MIQINSFIPTDNFTRRIWEFHEDKILIKTKSLSVDVENEIKYEKIKFIESRKSANLYWIWISFFIFGILSVTTLGVYYFGERNAIIDLIEKVVAFLALLLILPSFRKHEYLYFIDAEKNYSINIKIDSDKKRVQIAEAINLIKQKTNIIAEIYLNDVLPKENPKFEVIEFDFPDFLNKSTTRFYNDKIIETYKSLTEESVRITKYDELNGTTKTAKLGNDNWGYVWSYWAIFVCITSLSASIFFSEQVDYVNFAFGGFALLIPIFFLRFIKTEYLIFYDKNDDGILGIGINKKNQEKLNHIVEFVKSKVESLNQKPA